MDVLEYNKKSWDAQSASGDSPWSQMVAKDVIEQAKAGKHRFGMGPSHKPLPDHWLGDVRGKRLLCLAGGGGQQTAILAAMGATVTVFDLSRNQLSLDQKAAATYGLTITAVQGDMADLSVLRNEHEPFDLVVNPASTMFVPDLPKVWQQAYSVLKPGGKLIATTMNPITYQINRPALQP